MLKSKPGSDLVRPPSATVAECNIILTNQRWATLDHVIEWVLIFAAIITLAVITFHQQRGPSSTAPARHGRCGEESTSKLPAGGLLILREEDVPPGKVVFLFGTSEVSSVTQKQLCVIESAARHNHEMTVFVSWNHRLLKKTEGLARLMESYPNVKFSFLNIRSWLRGTPLQLNERSLARNRYPAVETIKADILGCAALFKFGGVYLDMDLMVLKSLKELKNALGIRRDGLVGTELLAFDRGHPVVRKCLKLARTGGQLPELSTRIGAYSMNLIMRGLCDHTSWKSLEPGVCRNVTLLDSQLVYYPWRAMNPKWAYEENANLADISERRLQNSYSTHVGSIQGSQWPIKVWSHQPFARMALKNCPMINFMHDSSWS